MVAPFCGLYLETYQVLPKSHCNGAYGYVSIYIYTYIYIYIHIYIYTYIYIFIYLFVYLFIELQLKVEGLGFRVPDPNSRLNPEPKYCGPAYHPKP